MDFSCWRANHVPFLVVIEKVNNNYSAYSPDFPGCVATGSTREEVEKNMYEAIEMHVQGLLEDNLPIPESESFAEYVAIAENPSSSSEVV
jgi:predicted RNase H-like HicB family nuclease